MRRQEQRAGQAVRDGGTACGLSRYLQRELRQVPLSAARVGAVIATALAARGFWADERRLTRGAQKVVAAGAQSEAIERVLIGLGYHCEGVQRA